MYKAQDEELVQETERVDPSLKKLKRGLVDENPLNQTSAPVKLSANDPVLSKLPLKKRTKTPKIESTHDTEDIYNVCNNNNRSKWHLDFLKGEKLVPEGKEYTIPDSKETGITNYLSSKHDLLEKTTQTLNISVNRTDAVTAHRESLPVFMEEQLIVEAVNNNDIVIINAETGSGKSTQIPQFLYEAGYGDSRSKEHSGIIVITEPRRIAAILTANRVEYELNLKNNNSTVGYQVRYNYSNITSNTKIKFVTEGILLNELVRSTSTFPHKSERLNNSKSNTNCIDPNAHCADPTDHCIDPTDHYVNPNAYYVDPSACLLSKYSCIIIDEAHEMSVSTDILLGWLTKICHLRSKNVFKNIKPLKLVIMSATMNTDRFLQNKLFSNNNCKLKVLDISGRRHKVSIHYNRFTPQSYLSEAYSKVIKIHKRLPRGNILVFLSGKVEVEVLCSMLRKFNNSENDVVIPSANTHKEIMNKDITNKDIIGSSKTCLLDCSDVDENDMYFNDELPIAEETPISNHQDLSIFTDNQELDPSQFTDEEEEISHLPSNFASPDVHSEHVSPNGKLIPPNIINNKPNFKLHILPLYSSLPVSIQKKVFENSDDNVRTVIVATNIAETSITLPNVRYVVDSGKVKQRNYNKETSSYTFRVEWTNKSSAEQRAGRAARMGSGHCYRLYSSAVFNNNFKEYTDPEILRVPLEEVCVNMKAIGINDVLKFPFFTCPEPNSIRAAEDVLAELGCVEIASKKITLLGLLASEFPIHPRYFKMIISAASYNTEILARIISIVSTAANGELLISEVTRNAFKDDKITTNDDFAKKMCSLEGDRPSSDYLRILNIFGAFCVEKFKSMKNGMDFCKKYYIKHNELEESVKLYNQLCHLLYKHLPHDKFPSVKRILCYVYPAVVKVLSPPSLEDKSILRLCILSGLTDKIARLEHIHSDEKLTNRYFYITKNKSINENESEFCYIDHTSCLRKIKCPPEWICFGEMISKSNDTNNNVKTQIYSLKLVTVIEPEWINHLVNETRIKKMQFLEPPHLPWYDTSDDCIKLLSEVMLIPQNWPLPPVTSQFEDYRLSCVWFARLLLEGKIHAFSSSKKLHLHGKQCKNLFNISSKYINKSPSIIINQVNVDAHTISSFTSVALGKLFITNNVKSLNELHKHRSSNINFMLPEYLSFFPERLHNSIRTAWISDFQISTSTLEELERNLIQIMGV